MKTFNLDQLRLAKTKKENYITVYFEPSGEWILQDTTFGNQSTGINYISIADENVTI